MRRSVSSAGALIAVLIAGCGDATTVTVTETAQAPPATATAPSASQPEFYAPNSPWNTPVARDAPLDRRSAVHTKNLVDMVERDETTVAIREYSVPIYRVPADQKKVRVQLDVKAPQLQDAFDEVPLPKNARPAGGSDAQLLVYQPATDTIWEFWRLRRTGGEFYAGWGGRMAEVSENPGYYRLRTRPLVEKPFWGFNATNIGGAAGVMTVKELQRGQIDHVLALGIPDARRGMCTAPARSTDGQVDDADAISEGARLRLDPELDVEALDVPPMTKMMARAAQRYGIVITNRSGAVQFYAEDASRYREDPYEDILAGSSPSAVANAFPFDRLQTVRGSVQPC